MGVVFFPSLPFMGVMLFPSFVLGNVSGEDDAFLVSLSLFSVLLSLPFFLLILLLFHLFFHISFSPFLFLLHKLLASLFSYSPLFHLSGLLPFISISFSFFLPEVFFFFERTACTVCFQDVTDDTTDCNLM